jgi:FlaA1/EpsC-like NDP-sugar epimerase
MEAFLFKYRKWFKLGADIVIWSGLTFAAYFLRLEEGISSYTNDILLVSVALIPIKALFVYLFGHMRRSWQYSSIKDLINLGKTVFNFSLLFFIGAILFRGLVFIPLSIPIIEGLLALSVLGGIRFLARIFYKEKISSNKKPAKIKRVIIAGAGDAGTMIAREMLRHSDSGMEPVAFIDDAVTKWNQNLMGIPVAGRTSAMAAIAKKYNAEELIIAIPSESGEVVRRLVDLAQKAELTHKIIPGLYDLISGKVSINELRDVDVEDLLRRKPVLLDTEKIENYIDGKRVLVTGAGGSIGSEIVRQISKFNPNCIVLVGRGENSIHNIVREMNVSFPEIKIHIKIADVRDKLTMEHIFQEIEPQVIFHAAAHKHVPLMEENPSQAIFNNVGGTRNLANLALDYGVDYFVNISTDKAVNPTSIMGASKRISEYIVQNAAEIAEAGKVFVSVRFGNVLGSRGSVIPIFKNQIQKGGPITVTHPEMIRYFMTIPEASQLVLQAGALNQNGAVFVLDMGEPVKIVDMARDLIRLSGLEPDKDIKIEYTGMREGEKLYEELLTAEEGISMTQFEKIMVAKKSGLPNNFTQKLDDLVRIAEQGDKCAIKEMIQFLVPTYQGIKKEEIQ